MNNPIKIPSIIATIEICSSCNAKCRWCTTGSKNNICPKKAEFMSTEVFESGIDRLFQLEWITKETKVELYNWGEPFLHPKLDEILHILTEKGLCYYLSTNGSIYRKLSSDVLKNIEYLMISIPGMSKDSYQKIHQLDIETVHDNIRRFSSDLKEAGVGDKLVINFHVYQFNVLEISSAKLFADEIGAAFIQNTAYFNDYRMAQSFLTGTIKKDELYEASAQLFLCGYQKRIPDEEVSCHLWHQVCFDHEFNLVPCCRLTTDERLGNLFDDNAAELMNARVYYEECKNCIESGQCEIIVENGLQSDWYLHDDSLAERLALAESERKIVLERLSKAEAECENVLKRLSKAETECENVLKRLSKAETERDYLNTKCEEISRQLLDTLHAYNVISNAASWKLTKPLRVSLDFLKCNAYIDKSIKVVKCLKNKLSTHDDG